MGSLKSLLILFLAVLSLTLCVESRGYRFLPEKGKTLRFFRRAHKTSRDKCLSIILNLLTNGWLC